jgi:hypothetical protein
MVDEEAALALATGKLGPADGASTVLTLEFLSILIDR